MPPPLLRIPPYSGTPENRAEIRALHTHLQHLECQALGLAVREWLAERQDRHDPFVISFSAAARGNNLRALLHDASYAGPHEVELVAFSDTLDQFLTPSISTFVHQLSDALGKIQWDPTRLDPVLARLLEEHAGVDGEAYLRSVDACKGAIMPARPGQIVHTLPGYLATSTELNLHGARSEVENLMTLAVTEDLHAWIHTWGDLRGHLPTVGSIGEGLHVVAADDASAQVNDPAALEALLGIFYPNDPEAFARVQLFVKIFFSQCAYAKAGAPMLEALEKTLELNDLPPGLLSHLAARRDLAALEDQVVPAGTGPRCRI